MKHTVFSVGYTGFPHAELLAAVRDRQLLLVDVRLKPASRFQPHWNRNALEAALGDHYAWVPELGNLNYKGGPIALKDVKAGLAKIRAWLETRDVALLCTCADATTCHRTVVTELLRREGYTTTHLEPAAGRKAAPTTKTAKSAGLF